jgi:uncharacterized phage infection (PIP) family protein YhgE
MLRFKRRIIGLVLVLIGVGGMGLSIAGVIVGHQIVDEIGGNVLGNLELTSEGLTAVQDTLVLAKDALADVNSGLDTVERTAVNVSMAISDTQPLVNQVSLIASDDIPNSIEAIEETIPSLVQVAGAIDDTLVTLNNFRIDENILGLRIQYDLGIDYQPDIPFDESVARIGESLDGLPDRLRSLDQSLQTSSNNLGVISEDVLQLSQDLSTINARLAEVDPLLNEYIRIVQDTNDRTRFTRLSLQSQLELIKTIVTIAMIWFGLNQLVPIYVGWEMLAGRFGQRSE